MALFFSDLSDETSAFGAPKQPIWKMALDDADSEEELLKWLVGEYDNLKDQSHDRLKNIQRNMALYKGLQYRNQENRTDLRDRGADRSRNFRKIVSNHVFDLVQNRSSRLIKFKPAVSVLPTHNEFEDQVAAKMTQGLLDHIWYQNNFEGEVSPETAKLAMVTGEAYLFILWNIDKGDLHPDYVRERDKLEKGDPGVQSNPRELKIPLKDENGEVAKDDAGNTIYIDRPVKVGDVEYKLVLPLDVFLQRKHRPEDIDYCFYRETMPTEEVRLLYPDKAKIIKSNKTNVFDFERLRMVEASGMTEVVHFFHRKTRAVGEGRAITFTRDGILSNTKLPYSHGKLPFVRFSDIKRPGECHGVSFIENIKGLTGTYNNLINTINRNQIMVSHPKWMMPAGSAKIQALGNDITVVEYKGPVPPQLVQSNPTPSETFQFAQSLKEEFQQISGVFGVSRGEPPKGVTAAVALQFLAEQESERANEDVLKFNEFIRQTALMTLAVAGDYYESDDERMIRVVGSNNEWQTVFFDAAHLSKDYDIRIQNSSALPKQKSARIQAIIDLRKEFPTLFTDEQVANMLELGSTEKFFDDATNSVRYSQAENEMILNEKKTPSRMPPQRFEDHIIHWKTHITAMRSYAYKFNTPQARRDQMEAHVKTHEMFIRQLARESTIYAEKVANILSPMGFPVYFRKPEQPMPAAGGEAPAPAGGTEGVVGPAPGAPINPEMQPGQVPVNQTAGMPPLDQAPGIPEPPSVQSQIQGQP